MKEIEEVISTLEEHLNEANKDIKLASQGYNVASEEYLQGRIDTLAQAIRIVKSIKSEPQTIIEKWLHITRSNTVNTRLYSCHHRGEKKYVATIDINDRHAVSNTNTDLFKAMERTIKDYSMYQSIFLEETH